MKNQVKDYVASLTAPVILAAAGTALVAGDCVVADNGYLGVLIADTPVGGTGAADIAGIFRFAKATGGGTALALRQRVYWDNTNKRVTATRPVGAINYVLVVEAAASTTDTFVTVRLLPPLSLGAFVVTATGSALGGLTVDTGLGFVPTAVTVLSRDTAGVVRVLTNLVYLTALSAGQVTITTAAGASTDTHVLTVYP